MVCQLEKDRMGGRTRMIQVMGPMAPKPSAPRGKAGR